MPDRLKLSRIGLKEAIGKMREDSHRLLRAYTLDSLGYAYHLLGDRSRAVSYFQDAEMRAREFGHQPLLAAVLDHLGDAYQSADDAQAARRAWRQALNIYAGLDHHDAAKLRAKIAAATPAGRSRVSAGSQTTGSHQMPGWRSGLPLVTEPIPAFK